MSRVDRFIDTLFSFLTHSSKPPRCNIIKKHMDNFKQFGEISFPWKINPWQKYIPWPIVAIRNAQTIFEIIDSELNSPEDACSAIHKASANWPLAIRDCKIIDDRVHIYLDRASTIRDCLIDLPNNLKADINFTKGNLKVSIEDGNCNDLTYHRLEQLWKTAKRLATLNSYNLITPESNDNGALHIKFTLKPVKNICANICDISCGPVLNIRTGIKETETTIHEYFKKRTIHMKLKAQHKYRVTVTDQDAWDKSLIKLGEATVAFDLLQIKPNNAVFINLTDGGSGCSKGAAFVLYNSARLTSIINTYKEKVKSGTYPPLPDLKDVDFNLLNDEDEWIILYSYIFNYQSVLKNSFWIESSKCTVAPHYVCSFLSSLAGRFSMYYRRIRILLEPREHLLPRIFARMHLLLSLQEVLSSALSVFDIELLSEM